MCFIKASIEHRKLAVDLAEVILKWELQRIKDDQEQTTTSEVKCRMVSCMSGLDLKLVTCNIDRCINLKQQCDNRTNIFDFNRRSKLR